MEQSKKPVTGQGVPRGSWWTSKDWDEIEKILNNQPDCGKIFKKIVDDWDLTSIINNNFCPDSDLNYLKNELLSLQELQTAKECSRKSPGFLLLWKKQAERRNGQGDDILSEASPFSRDVSAAEAQIEPCLDSTGAQWGRKPGNAPGPPDTAGSLGNGVCPAHNVNRNEARDLVAQDSIRFDLPLLQRHKWKCRSAPDVRRPVDREEHTRRLSQYDLPLSHHWDMDRPATLTINPLESHEAATSLLWGQVAYNHYKLLTMIETKEKLQMIKSAKMAIVKKYMLKHRMLHNIVDVAKAYYSDPTGENRRRWKALREEMKESGEHSTTDLRHKLAHVPHFAPVFTVFIMMTHVLTLVVMCSVTKLAPAGLLSEKVVGRGIQTFLGAETFHRYNTPNPWIGPPITTLLASGASFALCVRLDRSLVEQTSMKGYTKLDNVSFGCCEMAGAVNAAGTTTREECANYTNNAGVWGPPFCGDRPAGRNSVAHVIRPCCLDHRGTCRMLSPEHCTFLRGTFHPDMEHCVQVMCVRDICALGRNLSLMEPNPEKPWLPRSDTKWHWWRLLLALCYTWGIVHCVPLLALEWLLMRPLEKNAGWFRILMIYMLCGLAGQLVACTVQPYIPHVGSTSGVAGMIGEAGMELWQAWKLLDKPKIEAIKLTCFLGALLIMGLLPYVSLLATVVGCLSGAACTLIFMPYVTFHKFRKFHQSFQMVLGLVILLIIFSVLLHVLTGVQPPPCTACRSLDCLSFSNDMCNQWDLLG